ncbi:uncharacterized protein LOC115689141 [Syzygium oleosum]|uniref:uncharacterized protein LOC115689141 n=1 Tax=Syzygium oleosum TaxID=219896 RepID=UPI0024B99324|nr:uncharacterized protein LOC115689141 [Syzygium oleosum]
MDKAMRGTLIFVCSLVLLSSVLAEQPLVADDRRHPEQKPRSMVHRIMSSASSLNREKLATLARQAHAYFFPPEPRGRTGGRWERRWGGQGSGGEGERGGGQKLGEGEVRGGGFGQIRREDGGCECPQGGGESQEDAVRTLVPSL